jgi:hypothetical protein
MHLFGHNYEKEELEIIEHLIRQESKLIGIIDRLTTPPKVDRKPVFTLSTIINKTIYLMADIVLDLGTPKNGIFTLTDNKNGAVLTDAVFSNQAVGVNSNPEFATFALDPGNSSRVIGTPIAAGSGTIVITTDASYKDLGDGTQQSGSFSVTKNYSVVASPDGVSFDVVFS